MPRNLEREWGSAVAGVIFAALFVLGILLIGDLAGSYGDPDARFTDLHESTANRTRYILGGYVLSAGAIAFVWFIVSLTHRLTTEANLPIVSAARISGAVFVALLLASAASFMTVAGSITFGDVLDDEGQFATGMSVLPQLGYVLFNVGGLLAASSTMVAVSLLIPGEGRAPVLARRGGYVTALFLPASAVMTPVLVLLPLWAVVVSLMTSRRSEPAVSV